MPRDFYELQASLCDCCGHACTCCAEGSHKLKHFSRHSFQMLQPCNPLVDGPRADTLLWQYFNRIPPYSLTHNYLSSGGDQFFNNYCALMSALEPGPGAETVAEAQQAVMAYRPKGPRPVDWTPGYEELKKQLFRSPSHEIKLGHGHGGQGHGSGGHEDHGPQHHGHGGHGGGGHGKHDDAARSWTKGCDTGLSGLWYGSSPESLLSQKFATGAVRLSGTYQHMTLFRAKPGDWYSGAVFRRAYETRSGPPWHAASLMNWAQVFDPQHGELPRLTKALLVVSEMDVTIVSGASYDRQEQKEIRCHADRGMWPFQIPKDPDRDSETNVDFDHRGEMTIRVKSAKGAPVVIGCVVMTIAEASELNAL